MKNVLTAALVALVSMPTLAADPLPINSSVLDCGQIASMAGTTMKSRQNGLTATRQVEINNQAFATTPRELKLANALVIAAYEWPLMRVEQNKQRYITEFESEIFVACLKARR